MVHLRRRQGVPEPAAPAAAGDARESEEEARGGAAEELDGKSLPVWFLSTNSFSVCPVSNDSSTLVVVLFSFSVVILILFLIPLLEHTPHYPSLSFPLHLQMANFSNLLLPARLPHQEDEIIIIPTVTSTTFLPHYGTQFINYSYYN